jgi:hypothetical protein
LSKAICKQPDHRVGVVRSVDFSRGAKPRNGPQDVVGVEAAANLAGNRCGLKKFPEGGPQALVEIHW